MKIKVSISCSDKSGKKLSNSVNYNTVKDEDMDLEDFITKVTGEIKDAYITFTTITNIPDEVSEPEKEKTTTLL